jgi:hypothetical protein
MMTMRMTIVAILIMGLAGASACERAAGSIPTESAGVPQAGEWVDGLRLTAPAEGLFWLPCAAAGVGENVVLGGTVEMVEQSLPRARGANRRLQVGPAVTAIGVETGDRYVGTGAHHHFLGGAAATEVTVEDLFRLRSSRSAEPVYYRLRAQVVTDAAGRRVLTRFDSSIQCD